jgi:hypothetical protein
VLNQAGDINAWANAGPGAARGLGWVCEGKNNVFNPGQDKQQDYMNELMRELLALSRDPHYWPSTWPAWEMREVEHWLCEFDKWKRCVAGGDMKRLYR